MEDVISGEHLLKDIEDTITLSAQYLQLLTPANAIILVKHRGFQGVTKLTEPWYGTQYNEKKFDEELLSKWTAALEGITMVDIDKTLKLPVANPFLPTDFLLRGDTENAEENTPLAPSLIENIVVAHVISGADDGVTVAEGDNGGDAATEKADPSADASADPTEEGVVEANEVLPSDPAPEDQEEEEEEEENAEKVELKALPGRVRMTWFKQVPQTIQLNFMQHNNSKM